MAKKRKNRNNKSVKKSLARKRAFIGGIGVGGIGNYQNIVSNQAQLDAQAARAEELQKQIAAETEGQKRFYQGGGDPGDNPNRPPPSNGQPASPQQQANRRDELQTYRADVSNLGTLEGQDRFYAQNVARLTEMSKGTFGPKKQMTAAQLNIPEGTETTDIQKLEGDYEASLARDAIGNPINPNVGKYFQGTVTGTPQGLRDPASLNVSRMPGAVGTDPTTIPTADFATQAAPTRLADPEEIRTTQDTVAAERDAAQEEAARAEAKALRSDAQVQDVTFRSTAAVSPTVEAEAATRAEITGTKADDRAAAQIVDTFGFGSTRKQIIDSLKASTTNPAATSLAQNSNLSQQAASTIVTNPGALDVTQPALVAAVAELPEEALVSAQMDKLLEDLEDNEVPTWARPAVDAVNSMMVQRGLQASTVGRDALFNSIIQSAFPIAQANAQALQTRATQNLSNQQQALIQENQIAADFLSKNAAFQQQMELANLNNDQQMRLANLSARNQTASEQMTADQQTELANLNARLQTNLLQGKIAQQLGVAQLSVDQQRAIQNASMTANMDLTQFNAEQQVELTNSKFMQSMTMADFNAEQQTVMQEATALASLDMAAVDQRTKIAAQQAQSFLQLDMANISNEQRLSNQSFENARQQFNATSENQLNQFFTGLQSQMSMQNAQQHNAMRQFNSNQGLKADQINRANLLQMEQFNAQIEFQADQWNAANAQAVEQSNVEWRRKANTIDTAAENQTNQINTQNAFNLQSSALSQVWQQLRDSATFAVQMSTNDRDRASRMIENALANTSLMDDDQDPTDVASSLYSLINKINGTTL